RLASEFTYGQQPSPMTRPKLRFSMTITTRRRADPGDGDGTEGMATVGVDTGDGEEVRTPVALGFVQDAAVMATIHAIEASERTGEPLIGHTLRGGTSRRRSARFGFGSVQVRPGGTSSSVRARRSTRRRA